MAIGNMHKTFDEVRPCDFRDMRADRQTNRHTHHNTSHPRTTLYLHVLIWCANKWVKFHNVEKTPKIFRGQFCRTYRPGGSYFNAGAYGPIVAIDVHKMHCIHPPIFLYKHETKLIVNSYCRFTEILHIITSDLQLTMTVISFQVLLSLVMAIFVTCEVVLFISFNLIEMHLHAKFAAFITKCTLQQLICWTDSYWHCRK